MLSVSNELDLNVTYGFSVIKFWSTWCMPCKTFAPTVEKLDEEFENINFFSVDVEQVKELTKKYKVKTLPTLILIKDGEEYDRILGAALIAPLRAKLNELSKDSKESDNSVDSEELKSVSG